MQTKPWVLLLLKFLWLLHRCGGAGPSSPSGKDQLSGLVRFGRTCFKYIITAAVDIDIDTDIVQHSV